MHVAHLTIVFLAICVVVKAQVSISVTGIRLAGTGATERMGRVEIQVNNNNAWGTICSNGFSDTAALNSAVICRMLGFLGFPAQQNTNTFGAGIGPILMSELKCVGTEANIDECVFVRQNILGCDHNKDVAVQCFGNTVPPTTTTTTTTPAPPTPPPTVCTTPSSTVRLMDGPTAAEGRVEILRGTEWGTICDDLWGLQEAQVICRMLCYPVENARAHLGQQYKNGTGRIWLDNVKCTGNENQITDCTHEGFGVSDCTHREDAGVSCVRDTPAPPPVPTPDVRCQDEMIGVYFSRAQEPTLQEADISVVQSNDSSCGFVKGTTNTEVFIRIPFTKCGTRRSNNESSIIYTNVVQHQLSQSNQVITRISRFEIPVSCVVRRHSNKDKDLEPEARTAPPQEAGAKFNMQMIVAKDDKFANKITTLPVKIELGGILYIGITLYSTDTTLKTVVPECVATAQVDRNSTPSYTFIKDKCRLDQSVTFYPYNETFFAFSFQTFKFFGDAYTQVYLHCDAIVCELDEKTTQCDRSCQSSTRRKRGADLNENAKTVYHFDEGPFILTTKEETGITDTRVPHVSSQAVYLRSAVTSVLLCFVVKYVLMSEWK